MITRVNIVDWLRTHPYCKSMSNDEIDKETYKYICFYDECVYPLIYKFNQNNYEKRI